MFYSDESRAGAVILKDLALFNKAAIFFEDKIHPAFREVFSDCVSGWLKRSGWNGEPDVSDHFNDMWVCPSDWVENGEEKFAAFYFCYPEGAESNSYLIADICGVGESELGFKFLPTYSWFGGKGAWNNFAKNIGDLADEIVGRGWVYEGKGVFFRPVTLPADSLASSWEADDWSETLAPLEQALDALKADQELFSRIIRRAKPKSKPDPVEDGDSGID